MKKHLSLLFMIFMIGMLFFGFTGCGSDTAVEEVVEEVEEAVEEVVDEIVEEEIDVDALVENLAVSYFEKTAQSTNIIHADDVKAMIDDNPDSVFILDIRRAEDFEAGHIEGAYHSEWASVGEIMDRIPTNRPVVVTCYTGQTAGQAVGWLRMAGFDNVQSLRLGMTRGWTEESNYEATGEGMNAVVDLAPATSPANEEEEILWAMAQDMFADVATIGNNIIQPAELNEALEGNPNSFFVLDIRSADDFAAGHIEGSVHSPWAAVGEILGDLPTNRPIVVTCYTGQTAGQTVGVLRLLGFDAKSLASGMNLGWLAEDLPVVSE